MDKFQVNLCLVAAFAMFLTFVAADHDPDHEMADPDSCPVADMTSGPPIADTLIDSFLSIGGAPNMAPLCGMMYLVPDNATLYQGMLAGNQQHGMNLTFTTTIDKNYGHFINSINGITPVYPPYYWALFNNATMMTTPVGVDFIYLSNRDSYTWQYANSSDHSQTYKGPCGGDNVIPATLPLTYKIAYLTISGDNTGQFNNVNFTFQHVCKQLVLIPPSSTTAYSLLQLANDTIPLSVKAILNDADNTVTSLNGVANSGTSRWTGYRVGSNVALPQDLSMTSVSDGDHIVFKYADTSLDENPGGAPSFGQHLTVVTATALLIASAIIV